MGGFGGGDLEKHFQERLKELKDLVDQLKNKGKEDLEKARQHALERLKQVEKELEEERSKLKGKDDMKSQLEMKLLDKVEGFLKKIEERLQKGHEGEGPHGKPTGQPSGSTTHAGHQSTGAVTTPTAGSSTARPTTAVPSTTPK